MEQITLMPHQAQAVDWLISHGGIGLVHADAGTGKTFIAAEYIRRLGLKRVLILCPATLKDQWQKELTKFFWPEVCTIQTVDGLFLNRRKQWRMPARIVIANYELLLSDHEDILPQQWDAIFADESHMVNNPVAKRTKIFKELHAPVRVALSGDPFPNGELAEAYSLTDWFHPGILGKNFYHFRSRYCRLHPVFRQKVIGYNNREQLESIINRFVHRIGKEVLTDLPPKHEEYVYVTLTKEERQKYEEIERHLRLTVEGEEKLTVPNLLAMLMRLRQFIDCPEVFSADLHGKSSKQAELDRILREPFDGKTIVFTEFAGFAHSLAERYGCPIIAGDVSLSVRSSAVKKFQEEENCRLLVSTAAGNYGLNISAASRIIHFGVTWTYARINQRVSRAWRKGQTREIREIFLLADKTIDRVMFNLIQKKRERSEKISRKDLYEIITKEVSDM